MKTVRKIVAIVLAAVSALLLLVCLVSFNTMPPGSVALGVILAVVCLVASLRVSGIFSKKKQPPRASQSSAGARAPGSVPRVAFDTFKDKVIFPSEIGGKEIDRRFKDIPLDLASGIDVRSLLGQQLRFDTSASPSAVYAGGEYIGTLPDPELSDILRECESRRDPIHAAVTTVDPDERTAVFTLFTYRDLYHEFLEKYPDAEPYKLRANHREEMQTNIGICSEGTICILDYDSEKKRYMVSTGYDSEIGVLPASAAELVDERGERGVRVYVAYTETDDEGFEDVFVYLFPASRRR